MFLKENLKYDRIVGMHMAGAERLIKPEFISYDLTPYDNCKVLTLRLSGPTLDFGRKGYLKVYRYIIPHSLFDIDNKLLSVNTGEHCFNGSTLILKNDFDIFVPVEDDDDIHFIHYDVLSIDIQDRDLSKPVDIRGRSYRYKIVNNPCCNFFSSREKVPSFNSKFEININ